MKTLYFNCKLLTDIILSQSSATEGAHQTLDFIPGSNFLGIAASTLYKELSPSDSYAIFHSGKVRFGDAHISKKGIRALHIPAVYFYPKLNNIKEGCYIISHFNQSERTSEALRQKQLKQARQGYYIFDHINKTISATDTEKHFAIKSAYDSQRRQSKDGQMFGYESLSQESEYLFSVEIDNEKYADQIKQALCGTKRLGRSRTAQYGLVSIEATDNIGELQSQSSSKDLAYLYADSRLIFSSSNGMPTIQPTAEQLGFAKGATVNYERSQIRTFQYSPYNYKREAFDTDRYGIEKGSVLVIDLNGTKSPSENRYIGLYNNEGFGRVIYNPEFLDSTSEGITTYKFADSEESSPKASASATKAADTPLIRYLTAKKTAEKEETIIYEEVNHFVEENKDRFKGKAFAAQWGAIRMIAMEAKNEEQLTNLLFEGKDKDNKGYLEHGIAKEKWSERNRKNRLKNFIANHSGNDYKFIQKVIINLASEMAKLAKKEK